MKSIKLFNLIIMSVIAVVTQSCKKEMVVHVPQNYQGNIIIFFNQRSIRGETKINGNTIDFYPPRDGILFTMSSGDISTIVVKDFRGTEVKPLLVEKRHNRKILPNELYIGDARNSNDWDLFQVGFVSTIEKMKYVSPSDIDSLYEIKKSGSYEYWLK